MDGLSLAAFLDAHPQVERVEAFVCDVNGIARGKWLPRDKALEVDAKGLPLPRSIYALDIWGRDVAEAGLAFGTGDPDGLCRPVARSASLVPWAERPTAQVMLAMEDGEGAPFFADPRAMLGRVVDRLAARGLTPVVATELEFYLLPAGEGAPVPDGACQVLSLDALRAVAPMLDAIEAACRVQGVPSETMLRENGPGQYEVNLRHLGDARLAADHAILLKRIVRAVATRHKHIATFMAKPFGDQSGSGMHVHVSLLDDAGTPVFADADGAPTSLLRHAVGGLVSTMAEAMLLFASHANSYRRFCRGSHAPTTAGWGPDDRSAAVRVIAGSPAATRIEQRVPGADSNPYLALAGILAGVVSGIEGAIDPGPAQSPADEGLRGARLPLEWGAAIEAFAASETMADALGRDARDMIVACKRQDRDEMLGRVPDTEYAAYLKSL
jgi:glutamine synthetase